MSNPREPSERGKWAVGALIAAGERFGLHPVTEYPVPGGRIDVVWLWRSPFALPGVDTRDLPIAGFEVESSWRTRKHLKGDFLNLQDLAASLAVLVLLGDGEEVQATRRFAQAFAERPGARVVVWTDHELEQLGRRDQGGTVVETTPYLADATERHVGKYRALWAWLAAQQRDSIDTSFAAIEEIIGMPLPASSRNHAAHWSSYEGSAVVRAIHDAGFKATRVNLTAESLTFVRSDSSRPGAVAEPVAGGTRFNQDASPSMSG